MLTLISTTTCPNCKMAKMMLEKSGHDYEVIYADKNPEMALKLNVKKVPYLIVSDTEHYDNLSDIKAYLTYSK